MSVFFPLKVVEERDDALTAPTAVIIPVGTNELERLVPSPWILHDVIQKQMVRVLQLTGSCGEADIIG